MGHLWLRAEHKAFELRTPLIPLHAKFLLGKGHKVTVEQSEQRIYPIEAYQEAGCEIVPEGSWEQAPKEAYILGLKNLPESYAPLKHKHIYFAHAYKGQLHSASLLDRFLRGNGTLLDLEYLVDSNGKRVAAFGFYAGVAGAAIAVMLWCYKMLGKAEPHKIPYAHTNFVDLVREIKSLLQSVQHVPSILIIGGFGRCGTGAEHFIRALGIEPCLWGRRDVKEKKVNQEILLYDIMLNCILVDSTTTRFLNHQDLARNKRLSVIGDISCEPDHACNPLPFYSKASTFENPAHRIWENGKSIDLISIDNLPTFLPVESSVHFSQQLIIHLQSLLEQGVEDFVWKKSLQEFNKVLNFYFGDVALREVV